MSEYGKSDSYFQPGSIGRKTGFQVTRTPRRGANGLEDPKDFFLSDEEYESHDISNTSPAKRLSVRYELEKGLTRETEPKEKEIILEKLEDTIEKEERIRSSHEVSKIVAEISQNIFGDSEDDKNLDEENIDEEDIDEVIKKAEKIGTPIKIGRRTLTSFNGSPGIDKSKDDFMTIGSLKNSVVNGARLTKNIALNKSNDSTFQPQEITNAAHKTENAAKFTNTEVEDIASELSYDSANDENVAASIKGNSLKLAPEVATTDNMSKTSDEPKIQSEFVKMTTEEVEKSESPKKVDNIIAQKVTSAESETEVSVEGSPEMSIEENVSATEELVNPKEVVKESTSTSKPSEKKNPKPLSVRKVKPKEVSSADLMKELTKKGAIPSTPKMARTLRKQTFGIKSVSAANSNEKHADFPLKRNRKHLQHPHQSVDNSDSDIEILETKELKLVPTKSPEVIEPVVTKRKPAKSKVVAASSAPSSVTPAASSAVSPVRRSTRTRVPPVASWKNEKIVYKTEKINGVLVKSVNNIKHVETQSVLQPRKYKKKSNVIVSSQSQILAKKAKDTKKPVKGKLSTDKKTKNANVVEKSIEPRKRKLSKQSAMETQAKKKQIKKNVEEMPLSVSMSEVEDSVEETPKKGWQKRENGALTISLFEGPGTEKQVERTVAFAPNCYKNVTLIKGEDEYFKVGTLFDQDSEFCGGGIIELPPGAKKAVKSNHDTYFIFYVICGEVEVTLSRNTFIVTEGCSFEIPMGNYYQFVNTGNMVARMMFVQSKYVVIGDHNTAISSSDDTLDSEDD